MKKFLFCGLSLCLLGTMLLAGWQSPILAAPLAQLTVFPTPTPGSDGRIIYIAQEDDTLWRISAITGVLIDTIRELNQMAPDDNTVVPGQAYLLGYAGPVEITATPGPSPTSPPQQPTATASPGWGILCILLYNDLNGDAIRQEEEVSILGGAVNVGNRLGTVALSAETLGGGISDANQPTPQELGYVCFEELEPGEYTASAAAPEGYNATTESNRRIELEAGQSTLVAFGAQPDSESVAETALIPESGERSPLLGILGGALLLLGVGLGVWAALLSRSGKFKRPFSE